MKTLLLAAALLLPASIAFGQQDAAPKQAAPKPPAARVVQPAAASASPSGGPIDVSQIVGIRQIDATTYEIDAKSQNGSLLILRMNAFVMQDLGRQLGTYGKR